MIAFIDDHREAYGVEPICKVLPIAPSTYHEHAAKRADPAKLSVRARRDANLQIDIRRVWDANFQVYGVRKVWRQLQREAIAAPRCQVARLMNTDVVGSLPAVKDWRRRLNPIQPVGSLNGHGTGDLTARRPAQGDGSARAGSRTRPDRRPRR